MSKLTAIVVRNAKAKEKDYKLSDGYGLILHVSKSGRKTWRYRFKIAGIESTFVLGTYPKMSLGDARKSRAEARELVKEGKNPAHIRKERIQASIVKEEAKVNSFQKIALEWAEQQKERWSPNHLRAVNRSLKDNVYPYIGGEQVECITPPMLLELLKRIEKRGALEIARKVLQRINSVFMYAIRTGRATYNPAASLQGALKTRKVLHYAALSKEGLSQFLKDLSTAKLHISTKLGLQFLILTAARSGEVREASWSEIYLDDQMWRIPAERMKMSTPHNVPLSKQAVSVLDQIGQVFGRRGYVFPAIRDFSKPMSQNTLLFAMHRIGYQDKATVHGFRATFSTIANEAGFDGDVIEKALAHVERNRVRAAYHRSEYIEQRRELMQWWADYLDELRSKR